MVIAQKRVLICCLILAYCINNRISLILGVCVAKCLGIILNRRCLKHFECEKERTVWNGRNLALGLDVRLVCVRPNLVRVVIWTCLDAGSEVREDINLSNLGLIKVRLLELGRRKKLVDLIFGPRLLANVFWRVVEHYAKSRVDLNCVFFERLLFFLNARAFCSDGIDRRRFVQKAVGFALQKSVPYFVGGHFFAQVLKQTEAVGDVAAHLFVSLRVLSNGDFRSIGVVFERLRHICRASDILDASVDFLLDNDGHLLNDFDLGADRLDELLGR